MTKDRTQVKQITKLNSMSNHECKTSMLTYHANSNTLMYECLSIYEVTFNQKYGCTIVSC